MSLHTSVNEDFFYSQMCYFLIVFFVTVMVIRLALRSFLSLHPAVALSVEQAVGIQPSKCTILCQYEQRPVRSKLLVTLTGQCLNRQNIVHLSSCFRPNLSTESLFARSHFSTRGSFCWKFASRPIVIACRREPLKSDIVQASFACALSQTAWVCSCCISIFSLSLSFKFDVLVISVLVNR